MKVDGFRKTAIGDGAHPLPMLLAHMVEIRFGAREDAPAAHRDRSFEAFLEFRRRPVGEDRELPCQSDTPLGRIQLFAEFDRLSLHGAKRARERVSPVGTAYGEERSDPLRRNGCQMRRTRYFRKIQK